jgi:hypothetical protein
VLTTDPTCAIHAIHHHHHYFSTPPAKFIADVVNRLSITGHVAEFCRKGELSEILAATGFEHIRESYLTVSLRSHSLLYRDPRALLCFSPTIVVIGLLGIQNSCRHARLLVLLLRLEEGEILRFHRTGARSPYQSTGVPRWPVPTMGNGFRLGTKATTASQCLTPPCTKSVVVPTRCNTLILFNSCCPHPTPIVLYCDSFDIHNTHARTRALSLSLSLSLSRCLCRIY